MNDTAAERSVGQPEPCGWEHDVIKPASWVDEVGGGSFDELCPRCAEMTPHMKVFTPTALINPSGGVRPMDDGDAESMLRHKKDLEQKMREGKVTNLRLPKNRRKEFDPEYQPSTY